MITFGAVEGGEAAVRIAIAVARVRATGYEEYFTGGFYE
jgi:hypothetical protein